MVHLLEDPALRNREAVFRDRNDAGRRLAAFMRQHSPVTEPLVCAIPAGGIPIGLELAKGFQARMFLGVVRKLKIPWNPEAGFGSMTWNGKVYLNKELVRTLNLTEEDIRQAVAETEKNIRERIEQFTGGLSIPPIHGMTVIITDDGLASGYTMKAAVEALNSENPEKIIVAVPTGSAKSVAMISGMVARMICLNLRDYYPFAVADAYQNWYDLDDDEVIRSLSLARKNQLLY
ncbi:MAG: Phosphoribosyl transferase domain protein [Euryarchaeota archaeon ADurb.BinA087]|nr:MAG: Phosphoribosyl transferase domain protein [Euryarchaeota archaeon ADurb.BinA087]